MKWLAALFMFIAPLSAYADAGDVWVCNYRGIDGEVETNVYRPGGDQLYMGDITSNTKRGVAFDLRVDNPYAVIAEKVTATSDPQTKQIFVGLYTVIIDKHTMKFRTVYSPMEGSADFVRSGNVIADGNCAKHLEPHMFHDN